MKNIVQVNLKEELFANPTEHSVKKTQHDIHHIACLASVRISCENPLDTYNSAF